MQKVLKDYKGKYDKSKLMAVKLPDPIYNAIGASFEYGLETTDKANNKLVKSLEELKEWLYEKGYYPELTDQINGKEPVA